MTKPDDDHTCQPMYDADGNLTAVVHGDPRMSDRTREALAELVEAARRHLEQEFAFWADESLDWARHTFQAQAEVWPAD
jgi:hypothetical protein